MQLPSNVDCSRNMCRDFGVIYKMMNVPRSRQRVMYRLICLIVVAPLATLFAWMELRPEAPLLAVAVDRVVDTVGVVVWPSTVVMGLMPPADKETCEEATGNQVDWDIC